MEKVMITTRPVRANDAAECGRIIYSAFAAIAEEHNFPPDFPSVDVSTGVAAMLIAHPGFHGVVAAADRWAASQPSNSPRCAAVAKTTWKARP
jgi:hypothetical protein